MVGPLDYRSMMALRPVALRPVQRRDPARLVPLLDACLGALDAGRPDAAEALRRLICVVGDPSTQDAPRPPAVPH